MKKLLAKTTRAIALILMLLTFSGLHAQNTFTLTIQNIHQTSDRVLEFDFYLLDTDIPSKTFELASLQFGFMVNSSIYAGGTLGVSDVDTSSGLVVAQRCTANPNDNTIIGSQTEVKLIFPLLTAGQGTIISKVSPGTLLTHFILTSSVPFPVNSNPGITFNPSVVTNPYYGTKLAQFVAGISTQLDVNIGTTNAFVQGAQPNLNTTPIAVANGDWNTPSTWVTNLVPSITDDVLIPSGVTVTINSAAANCKTLNVAGTLTSTAGINTLTVNGDVTVNGSLTTGANTFVFNGSTTGAGTIDATSGTLVYGGTAAQTISNIVTNTLNNLVIANNAGVTLPTTLTVSSLLTINAGAKLTNPTGATLTIKNVSINSDNTNGTGTFVDNGTTVNTAGGTTNVQQYLTTGRNWYISSPVSLAPTSIITVAGSLWNYTEANSGTLLWNGISGSGNFGVTRGYVANMTANGNINFTGGALNTGALTISSSTLTRTGTVSTGFNLVGNPYPSYLNWIAAVAATNTGTTNMEPTMWYRTKNPSATYVFDTFIANGSGGGVGTTNFSGGTTAVTGYIPPMQAFWTRVASGQTSGTLAFDNIMRTHQDQSISTNRLKVPAVSNVVQQLLRLQVSNGINSDEAIVYFNPNASNGFDRFDAEKMSNDNAKIPEIYTFAGNEKVVINGLNNVSEIEELPLGFTTGENNTFTIKATEISDFDLDTKIILKDNQLGTENELKIGNNYSFISEKVSTSTRFTIVFKSNSVTTGIGNTAATASESIFIYKNQDGQITINRKDAIGEGNVTVCNAIGQVLTNVTTTGTVTVVEKKFIPGVYLVKVTLAGKNITKKVIIN